VAAEGKQEFAENGDRFLVLLNGKRYEGVPGAADYKIFSFERYAMRIEPVELRQRPENVKAFSTLSLLKDLNQWHAAELIWRIGLPISALLLALLAIPLSFVNPRAGRSFNLILALVIYMTYNNLLGFSTSWVGQGGLNMFTGLWVIHSLMAGLLAILFTTAYLVFRGGECCDETANSIFGAGNLLQCCVGICSVADALYLHEFY